MNNTIPIRFEALKLRFKPVFRLNSDERRFRLFRLIWGRLLNGETGLQGHSYSAKLSVSIDWKLEDFWIGAFWKRQSDTEFTAWICVVPCVPIRIHYMRSFGGWFS